MSDYISRESAKDNVSQFLSTHAFVILPEIRKSFDKIPSANVRENIHGEWIPKEKKTECSVDIDIVCSECGYVGIKGYAHGYELNEIDMQRVRDFTKELDMNFCPCCGRNMRGGTDVER